MKSTLYVGSYTRMDPREEEPRSTTQNAGLFVYQMDDDTGSLERIQAVDAGADPTFLAVTHGGHYVYVANHLEAGEARAFRADEDGRLAYLNRQVVHGADTCYVCLDPSERWLLAASYTSGNFTVLPLDAQMRLEPASDVAWNSGSGPNLDRQEQPHAHSIQFSPDGGFVFAVDLGSDRVWIYRFDSTAGRLLPHEPAAFVAHPGAGPRHMAYSVDGQYVYIANELDSTVTACSWDGETGKLQEIQTISTVKDGFNGISIVADIHVTPSGRTLYVSNRGENTIAVFEIDPLDGHLRHTGSYDCGGDWPRNFVIHPNGEVMLVANQYSGNIVVFRIAKDGSLINTGIEAKEHAPVCLIFAK